MAAGALSSARAGSLMAMTFTSAHLSISLDGFVAGPDQSLDVAPVLLGAGERLFDGVGAVDLGPVEVGHSPLATHVRYRISPRLIRPGVTRA